MIFRMTLNDLEHTDLLVKACNTLGKAVHRQRFIFKDQSEYEMSDYMLFDENKEKIEKYLKTPYEDLGKQEKLWFINNIIGSVIKYFYDVDNKNIQYYIDNLKVQMTDTYKDVDEHGVVVYVMIFSSKITPAIFVIKQ